MASLLDALAGREPRVTTSVSPDESVCVAVCRAVSDARGVDALDLPPLGEVVSVEALDGVASDQHGTGHVAFRYQESTVVVHADGTIAVYDDS